MCLTDGAVQQIVWQSSKTVVLSAEYYEECEKNDVPHQLDRTHYLHEYSLLYRVTASGGVVHISPDTQMFNEEMEKYRNEDLVPLSQVPSEGFYILE